MKRIIVLLAEELAFNFGCGAAAIGGARLCEPLHVDSKERVGFVEGSVSGAAAAGHRPALRTDAGNNFE